MEEEEEEEEEAEVSSESGDDDDDFSGLQDRIEARKRAFERQMREAEGSRGLLCALEFLGFNDY